MRGSQHSSLSKSDNTEAEILLAFREHGRLEQRGGFHAGHDIPLIYIYLACDHKSGPLLSLLATSESSCLTRNWVHSLVFYTRQLALQI